MGRQLPSLRAATTTNKNEKSPLSVSSGSGKRAHTLPLHRRFSGRWGLGRLKLQFIRRILLSFAPFLFGKKKTETWVGLLAGGGWDLGSKIVGKQLVFKVFRDD